MSNVITIENDDTIRPWDGNSGPSLPDGEYLFQIVEARADLSRAGAPVIFTRFKVVDGEYAGTDFQKRYVVKSDKEAAVGRTLHFLRVAGVEKNSQGGYDLNQLLDKQIYGTIQRRERPMINQQTGESETRTMSDLINERPYDEASGGDYQEAPPPAQQARKPVAAKATGAQPRGR